MGGEGSAFRQSKILVYHSSITQVQSALEPRGLTIDEQSIFDFRSADFESKAARQQVGEVKARLLEV
jgi:hypothetical protein